MTYEELLNISDKENLIVKEKDIPGYGGRIYKNRIAIHQGLDTQVEKACVLAEELGHHYTTSGNILDQSKVENRKQEFRARMWAYNRQIGLIGIVNACPRRSVWITFAACSILCWIYYCYPDKRKER